MEEVSDCGTRKHDYEFKGNKTFKTVWSGPSGTRIKLAQNAVYKCKTCGKVRRGPVKRGEPNDSL
jgi:hypothetical protein